MGEQVSEETKKTTAAKSTETARKVRGLVKGMYARARQAKEQGQPVAYCMVGCQYDEILAALGVVPIWTENYAGLCAAKRAAQPFLMKAEAEGYANVICGYARTGIGFDALRRELDYIPPEAPDGGMAEPDMLLGCSAVCDPRFKWYQALGHYKETPIYNIDVVAPPIDADLEGVRGYYIHYQREQLQGLVDFLERQTGRKMNWDLLRQKIAVAEESRRLLRECYKLRQNVPCPMPSQDHFSIFVGHYFLVCEPETVELYRELYEELRSRVEGGIGVLPEERYRLLWGGGLPPWHSMGIFDYFQGYGAVFVAETSYRPPDPVQVRVEDFADPLEYLATRSFERATYWHERARRGCGDPRVELLISLVEDYKVDGMVMHATRSCRATTIGQIHFKNVLHEHAKVPAMFMESDIIDLRDYAEAQTKAHIDAFMEMVDSYKRGGGKD